MFSSKQVRELSQMLGDWSVPAGIGTPWNFREDLAEHMIKQLGLTGDQAESFYVRVTSPFHAERTQ